MHWASFGVVKFIRVTMLLLFPFAEPKLIAPVVAYLCHESSTDNGAIIESAAGWATKVLHFIQPIASLKTMDIRND